jgi:hypothetical protein
LNSFVSFWADVLKDKDLVNLDFNKKIESEETIPFWIDR